jgi:hypothetical protein
MVAACSDSLFELAKKPATRAVAGFYIKREKTTSLPETRDKI